MKVGKIGGENLSQLRVLTQLGKPGRSRHRSSLIKDRCKEFMRLTFPSEVGHKVVSCEVKLEEVKGWTLENKECFQQPLWFPIIISQHRMCIKPFLKISENSAEVRKHCFMVAQFSWFSFLWSLGESAEKTSHCLQ